MSVRVCDRKENKLHVHQLIDDLVSHTLTKCANMRKFGTRTEATVEKNDDGTLSITIATSRERSELADRLEHAAVMCGECAWRANDIRVDNDPIRWRERKRLQDEAVSHIVAFAYLVRYTRRHCGLSNKEIDAWTRKASAAKRALKSWRDGDVKKHGHLDPGM